MFTQFHDVLAAIWHQDFHTLQTSGYAVMIYTLIATLITLESGFLPAAPLPCDSVVILSGTLAAEGILSPYITFPLLMAAASIGSILAFMQGRWLNKLPLVQRWLSKVPEKNIQMVDTLLGKHGLVALFCARFAPGVRSVLPMMMGIRNPHAQKFHRFSALSAVLWVTLLAGSGFMLPSLPERVSHWVTMALMAAPLITLSVVILSALAWRLRRLFQSKTRPV
ncbi:Inner membrane protein YghB [Vibrio stylophorae]|uniref:Inner membrane protein YghB n=1 Tax=Vibrio stylophorae TaxID=659351 RepID=A0ABN8DYH8_9VIBR|nr:DedA family protein [Vibrio stylophorae]CAH0535552.1 Inner membrane protein YghB [Vibrio stylophorae]